MPDGKRKVRRPGLIAPDEPLLRRLWAIQRLLGHETQAAFARELGITPARLGNIYNGAELSKEVAFRLRVRVPGLTLDWIWFGYRAGVPVELARRLRQFRDEAQSSTGTYIRLGLPIDRLPGRSPGRTSQASVAAPASEGLASCCVRPSLRMNV